MATAEFSTMHAIPPIPCTMCNVLGAQFVCATCGAFYCNVPCQVKDWPTHKDTCMPRLLMATPIIGTAACLGQAIMPAKSIQINKPNERVNLPSMGPNSTGVVPNASTEGRVGRVGQPNMPVNSMQINKPIEKVSQVCPPSLGPDSPSTPPSVPPRNNEIIGKSVSKKPVGADGTAAGRSPSIERNAIQQKAQHVMKSADTDPKKPNVVAEREVEKKVQKDIGQPMTESVSKNLNDTNVKNSTVVSGQRVEKNSLKAAISAPQKSSLNVEKPKQQKEETAGKNGNNAITMKPTTDAVRKENTGNPDPKSEHIIKGKLVQQGPFPEPGSKVKISYVADDKIYIYETGPGPNGERNAAELLIARSLECAQSVKHFLSAPPTVGDIVFAGFDGNYYRAVVKSVKNDIVEVFYMDFGNSQAVQWNTLKEIPDPKIKYANCSTHGVWIENIASFTPSIKEFLMQLENEAVFMLITVIEVQNKTGIKMVEMYHCSEKYNLSLKLLDLQGAQANNKKPLPPPPKPQEQRTKFVVTNPNTYTPVKIDEMIDPDMPEGKGIELLIINASNAFTESAVSVIMNQNFIEYKTMMQECEMYGTIDENPYKPKHNEICLVNNNGIWYRAATIMPNNGTIEMVLYLVDELCFADDKNVKIRRYPPGLTRQQFVVECLVENLNILLEAIGGNEEEVDELCGRVIKADIHFLKDEEMSETTHITIHSIKK